MKQSLQANELFSTGIFHTFDGPREARGIVCGKLLSHLAHALSYVRKSRAPGSLHHIGGTEEYFTNILRKFSTESHGII